MIVSQPPYSHDHITRVIYIGAVFLPVFELVDSPGLGVEEIAMAWETLSKMDAHAGIRSVESQVLTALSLASHATMWTWFDKNVTEPTLYLAAIPISAFKKMELLKLENEWILPLFRSIQTSLLLYSNIKLAANKFFPGLNAPDYEARCKGGLTTPVILGHVESAVVLWLQFHPRPEMSLDTSRAVATFISIMREAFRGLDFLYLSFVQNGVKRLRSILTVENIHLTKVPWKRLAEELKSHPLANPNSDEAVLLNRMKNLLCAVSGLPHAITETTTRYREAEKMGGSDGVKAFAQWIGRPPIT